MTTKVLVISMVEDLNIQVYHYAYNTDKTRLQYFLVILKRITRKS